MRKPRRTCGAFFIFVGTQFENHEIATISRYHSSACHGGGRWSHCGCEGFWAIGFVAHGCFAEKACW